MGGFDAESTRHEFELDAAMTPLVVIAVGRRDPDAELPETLAARERAPRTRHPLDSIPALPRARFLRAGAQDRLVVISTADRRRIAAGPR